METHFKKPHGINLSVCILCGLYAFIHLSAVFFNGYGIFRDELYYLACAARPAFGYVDHPPFSIWILTILTTLFGDSWQFIRIIPILAGVISIIYLIKIVRVFGGNSLACWLTGIAFIMAPINSAFSSFYSMNIFELLFWILAFYQLLKTLENPDKINSWVVLGVIVGLGMLNKISMGFFAVGMIVFIVISPFRHLLKTKGPYVAGIIASILFLPFIIWNLTHDMAHVEFAMNASNYKYGGITRGDFVKEQLLDENFLMVPLLITALISLFHPGTSWKSRLPMVLFIVTLVILLIKGHVKSSYMASAYAAVFISGSIWLCARIKQRWQKIALGIYIALYAILGLYLIPLTVPILSEETLRNAYAGILAKMGNEEGNEVAKLPQFYADMHGWDNFAKTISEAYTTLDPEDQKNSVAWVNNYGEAGAIEYFADKYPLPPVVCRHNNYYIWGGDLLSKRMFSIFILIDGTKEEYQKLLKDVEEAGTVECNYCMPYENHLPLFIGRNPVQKLDLRTFFLSKKNYI